MDYSISRMAVLYVALAGALPAGAQTFHYVFSSCASGVTMDVTLPVTSTIQVPSTGAFTYTSVSATFTLTIAGTSQVFNGLAAVGITYTPVILNLPDSTDVVFNPANNQGGASWFVNLQGSGKLLPNGLTVTLPPLSAWALSNVPGSSAMHYDYISVSGKFYFIDTFGACGGGASTTPASEAGKSLGNPKNNSGCAICGDLPSGDPIDLGSGNMFERVDDYRTFGANPLGFTRYYNSMAATNTFANTLGNNWRSNYDRYLRIASATSVIAERADGRQLTFTSTNGVWTGDTDVDVQLTNSGSTWTLTDMHDTVETYMIAAGTSEALLQSIRARNGYIQTLQYGAGNQLATVKDSFQRQMSFAYTGAQLQTVTTPDSLVLTYGYSGALLTSVAYSTSPATSQTYLYENSALPSALTGIVDENGNRYSHLDVRLSGPRDSGQHPQAPGS